MKFGGTSLGSAERIRRSAAIVQESARHARVIVVVSALASVTDTILKAVHSAAQGLRAELEATLQELETRHRQVIRELFEPPVRQNVEQSAHAVFSQFREFCSALLLLRSLTPAILDVALPMGEKVSGGILTTYLQQLGAPAEYVDSAGIVVTDEKFGDATVELEATRRKASEALRPLLERGLVPVVTGYSGATGRGQPTTLGRGGSDYSATILGAAVECDEVWIWTDVDGVLSADPRICPNARTLSQITYAEAIELSYYGAKVIHPKAVRPAMELGIPVWIKNSFQPELPGTKIAASVPVSAIPVKAVTAVTQASLLTLRARRDIDFAEIFGRLFLRLGHEHIDVLFSTQSSSQDALELVVRDQDTEHALQAMKRLFRVELKHGILNPVSVRRDIAVIAVLGEAMKGTPGILGRIFSAVAARNVSVIAVAQGASELNICFCVPAPAASDVVRAVHEEFLAPAKAEIALPQRERENQAASLPGPVSPRGIHPQGG